MDLLKEIQRFVERGKKGALSLQKEKTDPKICFMMKYIIEKVDTSSLNFLLLLFLV